MPTLSEWDASELEDIRHKEARYRLLRDQLITWAKADARLPQDDFNELHELENALASDVKTLLAIIKQLLE